MMHRHCLRQLILLHHMIIIYALLFALLHFIQAYGQSTVQGGMVASMLKFSSVNGVSPGLIFGSGNSEIRLLAHASEGLTIETPSAPLITFKPDNSIEKGAQQILIKSALDIEGSLRVQGVTQWILVHQEDFGAGKAIGWDNTNPDIVTECAGIHMLGGYRKFAKGEISKKITGIPPHDQLRVKANFHFIDSWIGESGFMRLNIGKDGSLVYVWTDRHTQKDDALAVNVCGTGVGEVKFSVPIDVVINHSADNVILGFGSTVVTEDAADQSWGVSGIEVYVRYDATHVLASPASFNDLIADN